jgi:hypothetical protein
MIVTITSGAHGMNTDLPAFPPGEPVQFAHLWDFEEPEDNAHQVLNFVKYATALGGWSNPVVLLPPPVPADPRDWDYIQVKMADWAAMVESDLECEVEIR